VRNCGMLRSPASRPPRRWRPSRSPTPASGSTRPLRTCGRSFPTRSSPATTCTSPTRTAAITSGIGILGRSRSVRQLSAPAGPGRRIPVQGARRHGCGRVRRPTEIRKLLPSVSARRPGLERRP
jgi:hypothetical protein